MGFGLFFRPMSLAGRTILLVEDNEDDVFFMEDTLKRAGIKNPMHVARDGQRAVDYLSGVGGYADRSRFPMPCLVLLDLMLPRMNGLEVLRWMRQNPETREMVVTVLSGSILQSDMVLAYQTGANAYLVKPPTLEKLESLTRVAGDCWVRAS